MSSVDHVDTDDWANGASLQQVKGAAAAFTRSTQYRPNIARLRAITPSHYAAAAGLPRQARSATAWREGEGSGTLDSR